MTLLVSLVRWLWRLAPRDLRKAAHLLVARLKIGGRIRLVGILRLLPLSLGGPGRDEEMAILGLPRAIIGIGEGARLFMQGLARANVPVRMVDAGPALSLPGDLAAEAAAAPSRRSRLLVSHLNPPELLRYAGLPQAQNLSAIKHAGYWAWELPDLPKAWRPAFHLVDAVWCPSSFTAEAVRRAAPGRVSVDVVPHPLHARPLGRPDRQRFGFGAHAVVVLLAFDLRSTVARKNPYGALAAFEAATEGNEHSALLVCKVVGIDQAPEAFRTLQERVSGRRNIRLMDERLETEAMDSLVASSDIVLSLHRSEGYGLLLAEGMRAGKAVVATGWSGNMDFMTPETSRLVPFDLVAVADPTGAYATGRWAEPRASDAAEMLRDLIENSDGRLELGARAAVQAERQFSQARWRASLDLALDHLNIRKIGSSGARL